MRACELCGAQVGEGEEQCARCGFVFQRELRSDARDRAILEKHRGKPMQQVRRDLKNARSQIAAYLDNIVAKDLSTAEMASLLDEALAFLQIPIVMGVDDQLIFEENEMAFIRQVHENLDLADERNNGPVASASTYIRLGNALSAMGRADEAMEMIDKALLINPRDTDAAFTRAKLLFYNKKYTQARKVLEKVMAKCGNPYAVHLAELIDQISDE